MTEGLTWQWDRPACRHELHKRHSRSNQHAYKQKHDKSWDDAAGMQLLRCSDWSSIYAYGAMIARAGLLVDCALESQSSSCAFSWDPIIRANNLTLNYKGICSPFWSDPTNLSLPVLFLLLLLIPAIVTCVSILLLWCSKICESMWGGAVHQTW